MGCGRGGPWAAAEAAALAAGRAAFVASWMSRPPAGHRPVVCEGSHQSCQLCAFCFFVCGLCCCSGADTWLVQKGAGFQGKSFRPESFVFLLDLLRLVKILLQLLVSSANAKKGSSSSLFPLPSLPSSLPFGEGGDRDGLGEVEIERRVFLRCGFVCHVEVRDRGEGHEG
eukprot:COSAG06_NODE_972_length_11272_cov_25.599123_9_plen_170_part_00